MCSCVLAIFTIDRFGRRSVLMVGGLGQSVAMFLLGGLSKVAADQQSASVGAAAGSFLFVYNFIFAVRCSVSLFPPFPWGFVPLLMGKVGLERNTDLRAGNLVECPVGL